MSGHNPPHGRLGQPNSTWNPLQVPYIPRQPQLAHMSSERSMARSPVTWHTPPTHQDQLYNFMTANHKNNLEINPMLPTFGRSSGMPLGSVDLSLSSAARSTPSPKGANPQHPGPPQQHLPSNIPPGLGGPPMPDQNDHFHPKMVPGHSQQSQQQQQQHHHSHHHHHQQPQQLPPHHMNTNHNRSPSATQIGGVIQSTAALKDRSGQHPSAAGGGGGGVVGAGGNAVSCSFLGNSGSSSMGLGTGSAGGNGYYNMMSSSSSGSGGVDGSNSINRPLGGHSGGASNPASNMGAPSEFAAMIPGGLHIKDAKQINNEAGKNGRDNMPSNNESSDLVKDILLHAMQTNAVSVSPKRNSPLRTPVPPSQSPTRSRSPPNPALLHSMDQSTTTAASVNTSYPMNPTNVPSTLEATDSTSGPKTNSSSNAASPAVPTTATSVPPAAPPRTDRPSSPTNQSITSNEDSADSNSSKSRRRRKPDRTSKMGGEELERMHEFLGGGDNSADKCDRIEGIDPMRPNIAVRNDIATLALEGISSLSQGLASDSSHSPHITDLSDSTRVNLQSLTESNSANGEKRKTSPSSSSGIANVLSAAAAVVIESTRKDSESNSDDCETIDKIAAMISSTENDSVVNAPRSPLRLPVEPVAIPTVQNSQSTRRSNGPVKVLEELTSPSAGSAKTEPNRIDTDKSFEEVENKLEEMFAGIDESLPACSSKSSPPGGKKSPKQTTEPTDILIELSGKSEESVPASSSGPSADASEDSPVPSTSGTQKKVLTPAAKRANVGKSAGAGPPNKRKKVLKKKPVQSKGASFAAAEERAASFGGKGGGKKPLPKGNGKKGNGSGPAAGKNGKTKPNNGGALVDSNGKYKGPFVQVKSDGSHLVINAPVNEDDSDKPQNKTKKFANSLNSSDKSKIRGLHVSTLSTKYDADTTDTSWMCVFCKTGPHKQRLGDLFGPYIISTKSSEFTQSQTDEEYFNVKRTRESLQSKIIKKEDAVAGTSAPKAKKRKTGPEPAATPLPAVPSTSAAPEHPSPPDPAQLPTDIFYGMIKAGDDSYEVWMHEDCLVWAPGVHIIGTRVVGLEAAIWNCCRHQCRICSQHGATLSCLARGCSEEAHVVCARRNDWELSDEFKSHCEQHSKADSS